MMFFLVLFTLLTPLPIQQTEPVSLEVLFDGVPEPGEQWVLTITLKAEEDLEKAEIWVEKSEGLKMESGSLFWHGVLKSGEKEVIVLPMTLVESLSQDLTVNLVVWTSRGKRFEKKIHRFIKFISKRL